MQMAEDYDCLKCLILDAEAATVKRLCALTYTRTGVIVRNSSDYKYYKNYKTIVKPAMTHRSDGWAVEENDTRKLHTTEMRMMRWDGGKTKNDHIKNEDMWGRSQCSA